MAVKRIVVYGGTFDPIHNGHLAVARSLMTELDANKVIVVPTGRPWLRDSDPIASPEDRLEMVGLAFAGESGIEVSDVDVVRPGTTYSIDTLNDLRRTYGDEHDYLLAIGSDSVADLNRWHRYTDLTRACTFAVVQRPGSSIINDFRLPTGAFFVDGPMVDVSATEIRQLYCAGDLHTGAKRVPVSVHRFIIETGLYR